VLGHPDAAVIADARPFTELGFAYLTVIELRTSLAGLSGTAQPATVAELAGYLGEGSRG